MNGREAHYGVDTGADVSTISEAEASRLGLKVHEAPGFRWRDGFGHAIAARIALADELVLSDFRLTNVLFIVLHEPPAWATLPVASQGTLGRNVLIELETVRWKRDGWLEFGFPAAPASLRMRTCASMGGNCKRDRFSSRVPQGFPARVR